LRRDAGHSVDIGREDRLAKTENYDSWSVYVQVYKTFI